MLNKKTQADLISWVVGTLVIILILAFFVFASSNLAKAKVIEKTIVSFFDSEESVSYGWIGAKTNLAFKLNSDNKEIIIDWVKNENSNE